MGLSSRRIPDRIVFDKLVQVLRFGCSQAGIADTACPATTIRDRRDEWITLGVFDQLARIAREAYDRIVGLLLQDSAVDGCITKAPGGGECAGLSPVDRRKQGLKRSVLVEGYGIPLGRVLAGASRHDSLLLGPILDRLDDLGPLPDEVTVHLDAGYDSDKTRTLLDERGLRGEIAHKGEKAGASCPLAAWEQDKKASNPLLTRRLLLPRSSRQPRGAPTRQCCEAPAVLATGGPS